MRIMRGLTLVALTFVVSLAAAYPVYLWALRRQERQRDALETARFDEACELARFRLAQGGEFWSARIMANRCDAAGR